MRAAAQRDKDAATRKNLLRDNADPTLTISMIDSEEQRRLNPLKEREEPS
jgi:hypothetical protein